MRVAICAALPLEAACLGVRRPPGGATVRLAPGVGLRVTGIGARRASGAARALLAEGAEAMVSWGIAAGLDATLAPGDLVIPDAVLGADGRCRRPDPAWCARLRAALGGEGRGGVLAEAETVLASAGAKRRLAVRAGGAVAADMESAAIAALAETAGVPWLVVRAISDDAGSALPRAAREGLDGHGRLRPARALRALLARPGEVGGLLALWAGIRAARSTLERVAGRCGPALAAPGGG